MIWWANAGSDAIQGVSARAVASGDSVPGLVRAGATGLEKAWHLYVDTLGYLPPKSVGQGHVWGEPTPVGKVPVEFCNIANVLGSSNDKYFGLTYPSNDGSSAMLLAANLALFGGWNDTRDLDGAFLNVSYATDWNVVLQATASHEEFHAVQFNYETSVSHFLFEASAVTMEKIVVPQEKDYLYFEAKQLKNVGSLTPLLNATASSAYPHAWYVNQIMGDLGTDILRTLWAQRQRNPNQSVGKTLRSVIAAAGWSFDTTLARYALRLGLSGRRSNWLEPGFFSFSDANSFSTLSETIFASASPKQISLDASEIQEWIDTTGNETDRLVEWIPDAGANLAHAWKRGTQSGSERLRGSIRQDASNTRQDVWAYSNPGPLSALRAVATSEGSKSWFWVEPAPLRTPVHANQNFRWSASGGSVLTGTPRIDTTCTPLLHVDIWSPVSSEDPFAGSVAGGTGGHALVLEDADRILSLRGAVLSVPFGLGSVWTGTGDGVWKRASSTLTGSTTAITLGDLDLSVPLRILASSGTDNPVAIVFQPRPNPSRGGEPVHFPLSGSGGGESLDILAADGTAIRSLQAISGQTEIVWDVRNGSGHLVRPGVYWYVWRGVSGARRGQLLVAQ